MRQVGDEQLVAEVLPALEDLLAHLGHGVGQLLGLGNAPISTLHVPQAVEDRELRDADNREVGLVIDLERPIDPARAELEQALVLSSAGQDPGVENLERTARALDLRFALLEGELVTMESASQGTRLLEEFCEGLTRAPEGEGQLAVLLVLLNRCRRVVDRSLEVDPPFFVLTLDTHQGFDVPEQLDRVRTLLCCHVLKLISHLLPVHLLALRNRDADRERRVELGRGAQALKPVRISLVLDRARGGSEQGQRGEQGGQGQNCDLHIVHLGGHPSGLGHPPWHGA